ncbi:ABC transporter permease [Thermophilibacter sp.]
MADKNLSAAAAAPRAARAAKATAPVKKTSLAGKIFLGVVAAYLLVPFLATLVYSLFVEWTDILPSGFTLRNYQELFTNTVFWASIGRTLILCLVSVAITIVLILLAMYVVVAVNRKVAPVMQFLCMIPYALQGVILSIGIISLYTGTGTILSNRMFMLFGAYTILVLPYIYQGIRNALNSIDAGMLIQAAEMLGCGRFRAYVQVVLPNILSGILVSSLLAESIIFGDFVLANNIAGTNYQNIQVFLQANMDVSSGLSSAIVVVIFVVVALVTALVLKLQGAAQNNAKEQA